jgi:hypothetical protein
MGSLVEELERSEAAVRAEADRLRRRREELTGRPGFRGQPAIVRDRNSAAPSSRSTCRSSGRIPARDSSW